MDQFQVPQFIEMEAKIIGPLSLRQFGYVATPIVVGFILSAFLKLWLIFTIMTPFVVLGAALAFFKINGIPFPKYLINALKFSFKSRVYIFKKEEKDGVEIFNLKKLEKIEKALGKEERMTSSLERLAALIQIGHNKT